MHIPAKKQVEGLKPYVAPLEGRRGKLRLDFNENTVGPSPRVLEAIRDLPASAYATYPEYAGLAEAFAGSLGVRADQVGLFNGVDAAIRAVFDAYGEPGQTLLTTEPTFGYYAPCAALAGMDVRALPYGPDLCFPTQAMSRALADGPRLCFICNPNNPTGTLLDRDALLALIKSAPRTLFAIDELYADFTGVSVLPQAVELDNVVVFRSLSKTAGIAALRVGVAVASPTVVERLARVTGPYDINMFGVVAALAALADGDHTRDYVRQVMQAKRFSISELERLDLRYHAAGGNYLLVWIPAGCPDLVAQLAQRQILVRSMANKPLISGSFRLTVGTQAQMEQFFGVLSHILSLPHA